MEESLKADIKNFMTVRVPAAGFSSADSFSRAPENHRPERICKEAQTVIVFGIPIPRGVLFSPDYALYGMHRTYHTVYRQLDQTAVELCNFIESSGPYHAMPVPSYAPMVFHGAEPWGILSLKHAAVNAGLGAFGKSGQVYHPEYGSLLRLGAVVTSASIQGDPVIEKHPCPEGCRACIKNCPAGAFDESGAFNKMVCLPYSVKHAIYPLALKGTDALKHLERVVNTAGHDYWLACGECLRLCPKNMTGRNTK
ncbi:MAG: 4Fe-4S double cluster binding domain-containing protein [Desulfosalsimonas sp.]